MIKTSRIKTTASDLIGMRNLGPTIIARLAEIGVRSKRDLARLGPVEAYRRLCAARPRRTHPVCYYLYSLQGALMDLHWDDLAPAMKSKLKQDALNPPARPRRG